MFSRTHYLKLPYCDPLNFPQGLEAAGLSRAQARLIKKYGHLIHALLEHDVADPTSEDLHLLKVISRRSNPKSPVEQAWLRYLELIDAQSIRSASRAR